MTDVSGKFFSAKKVRTGVSPSSPGVEVGQTLPPVNPPGTSLNSVGLTMPSAFTVSNSPLTANGTIGVAGAGTVGQYIRGDGSLADFPESSGGGSSVSYYLNGSVAQGTIGGVAYKEMNKVPILGAGTDFTINANGYIASFITDAGDPNLLEIPGGNWNFETYFSASSNGGSPTFYVELYKYNGTTFTLIASNSAIPEFIAFGTNITAYFTTLAVPTTTLALTDRLAVRYYVTHSGRTITMHTEGPHLCQIITTFTTGLTALNGLTAQVQNFAVGTTGTDFNIASAVSTHTFNLPTASATNRGALSSADWALFTQAYNDKINSASVTGTTTKTLTLTQQDGGTITASWSDLNTDAVLSVFGRTGAVVAVSGDYTTAQVTESGNLYYTEARVNANANVAANTAARHNAVTLGTANGLSLSTQVLSLGLASAGVTGALSGTDWSTFNGKQNALTLTTTGSSGAATLVGATLNIPNYGSALSGYLPLTGGTLTGPLAGTSASFNTTNAITLTASDSRIVGGDTTGRLLLGNSGTTTYGIFYGSSHATLPNVISFVNNNTPSLTLASSGTATFSSLAGSGTRMVVSDSNGLLSTQTIPLGTVTSVTASSPLFSSGGTTPNITIQQASGSQSGFLSSTDWTTFNNKQNALTNPVTGTGTTNYLPKFTGTSSVGNSALFDGGGFGGFNSTGIASRTFVINAASGRPLALEAVEFANIHSVYVRPNNSGFNLITSNYISGGVYLPLSLSGRENNSDLVLQTSGNVTIGTTSDNGARLQVSGTATFSSSVTAASLSLSGTIASGGDAATLTIKQAGTTFTNGIYLERASERNGYYMYIGGALDALTFRRNYFGTQSDVMSLTRDGNVGIGTPSPNRKLEVITGSLTTNGIRLTYASGVATEGMDITYLNTGNTTTSFDSLYNSDSAIMQFRMKTAGTAVTALSILGSGAATFSSSVNVGGVSANTDFRVYRTVAPSVFFSVSAPGGTPNTSTLGVNGTDVMSLNASGNVLIGTITDNGNRLRVNGTIFSDSSVTATSFFESSDSTLKTLVEDNYQAKGIDSVVAKLYIKNGKEELGYFAQDLQGVLPSAVSKGSDGLLNLSYREVHTAKIAYLEEEIRQIKKRYEIN